MFAQAVLSSSVAVIPRHLLRWRRLFCAPTGLVCDLCAVASLRDPSLTLEDDATGHGECAPTERCTSIDVRRGRRHDAPHWWRKPIVCKSGVLLIHRKRSPFPSWEGFFAPLRCVVDAIFVGMLILFPTKTEVTFNCES